VRLLLDTHALIWSVDEPAKLGPDAAQAISDPANELLLSAASIWELSIKVSLGKLGLSLPFREWMDRAIADLGVALLPINVEYADAAANLPNHHGNPFDRMIVGQAHVEGMSVASGDAILDKYRINRLW
jgi:PIN domain nuclease of toxin-antitoxin system